MDPSFQPSEGGGGGGGNGDGDGDASEAVAPARGTRFTQPPRCWDLQLDAPLHPMVPSLVRPSDQRLFAFPECKLHVGSPCEYSSWYFGVLCSISSPECGPRSESVLFFFPPLDIVNLRLPSTGATGRSYRV